MFSVGIRLLLACLPGLLALPLAAQAVADTTASVALRQEPHAPRTALIRAAMVPGWGQIYNRHFYKLPIVYGGLGFLVYKVVDTQGNIVLYRRAALVAQDPEAYARYRAYVQKYAPPDVLRAVDQGRDDALRQLRDNFKRNRDLFVFGVGLFYGLTMLDAFVSAHLRDFDVGESLSIELAPGPGPALAPTLRLQF